MFQQVLHLAQGQAGPVVFCFQVFAADLADEEDLLAQIVESDDLVEEHEVDVLEPFRIDSVQVQGRFRVLDIVVGPVAHKAARKGGQVVQLGTLVIRRNLADHFTGMVDLHPHGRTARDSHRAIHTGQFQLGVVAQEGVAAPLFAVFHRFQKEHVAADVLQFAQQFDGRDAVGIHFAAHGDGLIPLGGELFRLCQGGTDFHDFPPQSSQ